MIPVANKCLRKEAFRYHDYSYDPACRPGVFFFQHLTKLNSAQFTDLPKSNDLNTLDRMVHQSKNAALPADLIRVSSPNRVRDQPRSLNETKTNSHAYGSRIGKIKHVRRTALRMWIPDSIIWYCNSKPVWYYTNPEGLLVCTTEFNEESIRVNFARNHEPDAPIAVLKRMSKHATIFGDGTDSQIVTTATLTAALTSIRSSEPAAVCMLQRYIYPPSHPKNAYMEAHNRTHSSATTLKTNKLSSSRASILRVRWVRDKGLDGVVISNRRSCCDALLSTRKSIIKSTEGPAGSSRGASGFGNLVRMTSSLGGSSRSPTMIMEGKLEPSLDECYLASVGNLKNVLVSANCMIDPSASIINARGQGSKTSRLGGAKATLNCSQMTQQLNSSNYHTDKNNTLNLPGVSSRLMSRSASKAYLDISANMQSENCETEATHSNKLVPIARLCVAQSNVSTQMQNKALEVSWVAGIDFTPASGAMLNEANIAIQSILEFCANHSRLSPHLRLDEIIVDFTRDSVGLLWCLQVKAFRMHNLPSLLDFFLSPVAINLASRALRENISEVSSSHAGRVIAALEELSDMTEEGPTVNPATVTVAQNIMTALQSAARFNTIPERIKYTKTELEEIVDDDESGAIQELLAFVARKAYKKPLEEIPTLNIVNADPITVFQSKKFASKGGGSNSDSIKTVDGEKLLPVPGFKVNSSNMSFGGDVHDLNKNLSQLNINNSKPIFETERRLTHQCGFCKLRYPLIKLRFGTTPFAILRTLDVLRHIGVTLSIAGNHLRMFLRLTRTAAYATIKICESCNSLISAVKDLEDVEREFAVRTGVPLSDPRDANILRGLEMTFGKDNLIEGNDVDRMNNTLSNTLNGVISPSSSVFNNSIQFSFNNTLTNNFVFSSTLMSNPHQQLAANLNHAQPANSINPSDNSNSTGFFGSLNPFMNATFNSTLNSALLDNFTSHNNGTLTNIDFHQNHHVLTSPKKDKNLMRLSRPVPIGPFPLSVLIDAYPSLLSVATRRKIVHGLPASHPLRRSLKTSLNNYKSSAAPPPSYANLSTPWYPYPPVALSHRSSRRSFASSRARSPGVRSAAISPVSHLAVHHVTANQTKISEEGNLLMRSSLTAPATPFRQDTGNVLQNGLVITPHPPSPPLHSLFGPRPPDRQATWGSTTSMTPSSVTPLHAVANQSTSANTLFRSSSPVVNLNDLDHPQQQQQQQNPSSLPPLVAMMLKRIQRNANSPLPNFENTEEPNEARQRGSVVGSDHGETASFGMVSQSRLPSLFIPPPSPRVSILSVGSPATGAKLKRVRTRGESSALPLLRGRLRLEKDARTIGVRGLRTFANTNRKGVGGPMGLLTAAGQWMIATGIRTNAPSAWQGDATGLDGNEELNVDGIIENMTEDAYPFLSSGSFATGLGSGVSGDVAIDGSKLMFRHRLLVFVQDITGVQQALVARLKEDERAGKGLVLRFRLFGQTHIIPIGYHDPVVEKTVPPPQQDNDFINNSIFSSGMSSPDSPHVSLSYRSRRRGFEHLFKPNRDDSNRSPTTSSNNQYGLPSKRLPPPPRVRFAVNALRSFYFFTQHPDPNLAAFCKNQKRLLFTLAVGNSKNRVGSVNIPLSLLRLGRVFDEELNRSSQVEALNDSNDASSPVRNNNNKSGNNSQSQTEVKKSISTSPQSPYNESSPSRLTRDKNAGAFSSSPSMKGANYLQDISKKEFTQLDLPISGPYSALAGARLRLLVGVCQTVGGYNSKNSTNSADDTTNNNIRLNKNSKMRSSHPAIAIEDVRNLKVVYHKGVFVPPPDYTAADPLPESWMDSLERCLTVAIEPSESRKKSHENVGDPVTVESNGTEDWMPAGSNAKDLEGSSDEEFVHRYANSSIGDCLSEWSD